VPSKKPRRESAHTSSRTPPDFRRCQLARRRHIPSSRSPLAPGSDDDRGAGRPFPVVAAWPPARESASRPLAVGGAAAAGPHGPRLAREGWARVRDGGGGDRALMPWAISARMTRPWYLGYRLPPLCLKEACSYAAGGGNQEVLEWLHSTGCPWNAWTACAAAAGGHLEVVKWLHNHGCPWNAWACAHAALSGHLRVLQWVREHHCPWHPLTTAWAAEGRHVAVLQWARANGCPWDFRTCMYAARAGQLVVLQWVREHDATGEAWDERLVRDYATGPREQEVLTWLDELHAP